MAVRKILTYPHDVLREKAQPVCNIDGKLQDLIDDMAQTMYCAPGIGLAGNQVGALYRVIVFDTARDNGANKLCVVLNPEIVETAGEIVHQEGCLSVQDYFSDVKRAEKVVVTGLDREGNPITLIEEGLPAIVLQHEIDHLNGTLFIDHISKLKRELYKRRLKKALREASKEEPSQQ